MTRISIKSALAGLFALAAAISIGQGVSGLYALSELQDRLADVTANWMPSVDIPGEIARDVADDRLRGFRYVTSETAAEREEAMQRMTETEARQKADGARYVPRISSTEERALYDTFHTKWQASKEAWAQVVPLSRTDPAAP